MFYELYLPAAAEGGAGTLWDVTELIETPTDAGGWCVAASYFRSGTTPVGVTGVKPSLPLSLARGQALNAAAVYWQTAGQTAEALRCMCVGVTDTTCKTNSTVMDYGVVMGMTARLKTMHLAHYALNGLTRANYSSMWMMFRLFMGACAVGRMSFVGSDGDQWLGEAIDAAIEQGGCLCVGLTKRRGLCRFHAINIPSMGLMGKHGFNAQERLLLADIRDRIHAMFRSCETADELVVADHALRALIRAGNVPHGPTRRQRASARTSGSVRARRSPNESPSGPSGPSGVAGQGKPSKPSKRPRKTKFEVQCFRSARHEGGGAEIEVAWRKYDATTWEQPGQLAEDLGDSVFAAFCHAAGIDPHGIGTNGIDTAASGAAAPDEPPPETHAVQGFVRVCERKGHKSGVVVEVKWLGFKGTTTEPAGELVADLGLATFTAFCNAASIELGTIDTGLKHMRDARGDAATIVLTWYSDAIWPKRQWLAWCFRRGTMHLGQDTSNIAESNFHVVKAPGHLNDKAPIRQLSAVTAFQERRRFANLKAEREREFGMEPPPVEGVPRALLGCWTRVCLGLLTKEAKFAGLGGAAMYHIWAVPPGGAPTWGQRVRAAWALQKASRRGDGTPHRVRIVLDIDGVLVCTCWVWEVWSVECRHCLAIHGSVAETSAAPFWRRGTVLGVNDSVVLPLGQLARGPPARRPGLHAVKGGGAAPAGTVVFHPWHVQLAGAGAAPAAVPFPKAQATIAPQPSVGGQSNHHLGLATAADASRIVDIVASASTRPADAAAIRAGVAALLRQAQAAHSAQAGLPQAAMSPHRSPGHEAAQGLRPE